MAGEAGSEKRLLPVTGVRENQNPEDNHEPTNSVSLHMISRQNPGHLLPSNRRLNNLFIVPSMTFRRGNQFVWRWEDQPENFLSIRNLLVKWSGGSFFPHELALNR
jgi:hypothetical protein